MFPDARLVRSKLIYAITLLRKKNEKDLGTIKKALNLT